MSALVSSTSTRLLDGAALDDDDDAVSILGGSSVSAISTLETQSWRRQRESTRGRCERQQNNNKMKMSALSNSSD